MRTRKLHWAIAYCVHLVVATIGVVLCFGLISTLFPKLHLDFGGPSDICAVAIVGIVMGALLGSKERPLLLALLWIPFALFCLQEIWTDFRYQYAGEVLSTTLYNEFLGKNCGASECLGQLFGTEPLTGSLAYGVGALLAKPLISTLRSKNVTRAAVLFLIGITSLLAGCKSAPAPTPAPVATKAAYPPRPTITPPPFRVFHSTDNSITLVTDANATDDQIAAILWQLHDAARTHTFDKLHIPQQFVDKRDPMIWFHIYRGAKCASEKYTTGKLPCGPSYHAAGDYTLGSFSNKNRDDGVLLHADDKQTELWNPDIPTAAP